MNVRQTTGEDLFRAVRIAVRISPLENPLVARTEAVFNAEMLFTRIVQTGSSIVRLIERQPHVGLPRHIDAASVASLTRNLVEGYTFFWFLCIEKVSDDERDFRNLVAALHHETERQEIYAHFGLDPLGPAGVGGVVRPFIEDRLAKNAVFRSLNTRQQADVLRGKRSVFGSGASPRARRVNEAALKGLYKWCSNHTHSQPFSHGADLFDSQLNRDQLLRMCIEASGQHICFAILDYLNKLRRFMQFVSAEERSFVRGIASTTAPRPPDESDYQQLMERWQRSSSTRGIGQESAG